ncbi:hypothetical protein Dsin_015844 [Dipteronia sinensis]|uniref:Glycosyltransferase n=1 Tax=Dipteronia sinensis TaxID=43782 RepID=A0AAE0ACX3_9ROSI|nr:hypothetical protein Dsin_015844 [Dipteronia sinensis]
MACNRQLHIAIFPWLAFGHLIPNLELAKLIVQKGHKISFISTPRNIDRLPKLPHNLSSSITFVKLSLPQVENLPENAEATSDVPVEKVPYLKTALDGLQQPLAQFLEASSPDWIIYDFAPHWLPPIAAKLGISRVCFLIFNSWTVCFLGSSSLAMINGDDPRTTPEDFTVPPEWIPFPSNLAYRLHEAKLFLNVAQVNTSGLSDLCRTGWAISGCDVFVLRSCFEIESDWIQLIGEIHQKPVVPIGLLPPSLQAINKADDSSSDNNIWITISEWFGKQDKGSVVYVAFGSELSLSQEEITELALGLELSGLPFFWVLRKSDDSCELPEGFEERIKGRGLVWTSWAPQQKILSHESVGGFLTHCGWSSIIEGLQFGRALVMLPFQSDQGLNARIFEGKLVGKEIPRDEDNGSFSRNEVAKTLRLVILEDEGRICRDKAKEISKIFGDKDLHHRYVDTFIGKLLSLESIC